jgi:hypothetical protein
MSREKSTSFHDLALGMDEESFKELRDEVTSSEARIMFG